MPNVATLLNLDRCGKRKVRPAVTRPLPACQLLPTATLDITKPVLKLGLEVHLEFIMAVALEVPAPLPLPLCPGCGQVMRLIGSVARKPP